MTANLTEVITLVEANIRSVPMLPLPQAKADIDKLFDIDADIVTGAEIVKQFRGFWHNASQKADKRVYGAACEVPVSVTKRFKVAFSRIEFLTKGVAHITPNRYQTRVKFTTARGFKVAVIAKHPVSQWRNPRSVAFKLRNRLGRLDTHLTKLRVRRLVKQGYTVLISGDLNSPKVVHYHPDQVNVANIGLMQLTVVAAKGVTVKPMSTVAIRKGIHTDHPFVINHLQLGRAAA